MILGTAGLSLIEQFEVFRANAYQDQRGIWTIGYGHTINVKEGDTCTQAQADAWLESDCETAVLAVRRHLDVALNQNQFDALVSFTFNLGAGSEAHSTLLSYVNYHNFVAAAAEFPKWNHCAGVVNDGLTRRRAAERALFEQAV